MVSAPSSDIRMSRAGKVLPKIPAASIATGKSGPFIMSKSQFKKFQAKSSIGNGKRFAICGDGVTEASLVVFGWLEIDIWLRFRRWGRWSRELLKAGYAVAAVGSEIAREALFRGVSNHVNELDRKEKGQLSGARRKGNLADYWLQAIGKTLGPSPKTLFG